MKRFMMTAGDAVASKVARQFPVFGTGDVVYYWAENGLVRWEDGREHLPPDQRYGSMGPRDAMKRYKALSEIVPSSSEKDGRAWGAERRRMQLFLCDLAEVIKEARQQGSPYADDAQADRRRRRPISVVVPQNIVDLTI